MMTIAADALYTALRRRGTTLQLAVAIVVSVISALLLLPALLWYHLRFTPSQATISSAEVQLALLYVALWGWLLPLGITASYCLFTLPRTSSASMRLPSQQQAKNKRTTRSNAAAGPRPPRYQPGVQAPFVFGEDTPWGWLEYRSGNFGGQRLELKRAIITLGRDEENDIWIDDDMASRHHAELAFDQGKVYLTDCDSLNGVLLNGRRIQGSVEILPGELLEIGSLRFLFVINQPRTQTSTEEDPLIHHTWRSSLESLTGSFPPVTLLKDTPPPGGRQLSSEPDLPSLPLMTSEWQETASLDRPTQTTVREQNGVLIIRDGPMVGTCFLLDRPVVTIGRGTECDVLINDVSVSRQHAQFLRQANGDYIQDLTSRNGTKVNQEALTGPRLLASGDIISIGVITLEYSAVQAASTAPLPLILAPRPALKSISGPVPLRLPSRQKP